MDETDWSAGAGWAGYFLSIGLLTELGSDRAARRIIDQALLSLETYQVLMPDPKAFGAARALLQQLFPGFQGPEIPEPGSEGGQ